MITDEIKIPEEFADVCPFSDEEFGVQVAHLVEEPMFRRVVEYAMPGVQYEAFKAKMLSLKGKDEFQMEIMRPYLETLTEAAK